ncbi:MAG TPA: hypothetical protein VK814_11325 [Acidobacteriaceae bacterium]|nr:hypothetical protein [Acidobacteriaceae bacterium]
MLIGINVAKLREGKPHEYLTRFLFGGAVTVIASLITGRYGPILGGLFMAFPGIFAPGLSMTETHAIERKAAAGAIGTLFARAEASVEAAGASAGALGLAAFALVLWKFLPTHTLALTLPLASAAWLFVSVLCWWLRKRFHI